MGEEKEKDDLEKQIRNIFDELGDCNHSVWIMAKAIRVAAKNGLHNAIIYLDGELEGLKEQE